jgi:phosphatidylserine decarboxylase
MVVTGLYYALGLVAGGLIVSYLTRPAYGIPFYILAAFCLYFFRDPDRVIPPGPVAVSPADGKVVAIRPEGEKLQRISIFLNIFDVHVNRSPIAGTITKVEYRPGKFLVASREDASTQNEMNVITVEGEDTTVVFKQIAGLVARRVVCDKKPGDIVAKGDRIGLIKFGSRTDVLLGPEWKITVREGQRVAGGSSILARRLDAQE